MTLGFCYAPTYRLVFEDERLAGLEVRSRSMTIGALMRSAELERDGYPPDETLALFCEHIIEWNLQDERADPVALTPDGLRTQDKDLIFHILGTWRRTILEVPDPLGRPSSAGEQSEAPPLPMEPLSESQAS